jgi:hypothetical protein
MYSEPMSIQPGGRQSHLRYYYFADRDHSTCTAVLIRAEPVEAEALQMVKAPPLPREWQVTIVARSRRCHGWW